MNDSYPVLLVEDDPISQKILQKILLKEGFDVTTAENGRIAIELFKNRFFPIVLTDWLMPEMEGPDLCRAIRDQKPEGYVYIVLLTAKDSKTDIISGLEAGADDYLTKPAHRDELVARIKNGLRILELEKSLKEASLLILIRATLGHRRRVIAYLGLPEEQRDFFTQPVGSRRKKKSENMFSGET